MAIRRVDRDDPRAEAVQGEVMEEELRAVLEEERHAMAVTIATGPVAGLELQDTVAGLAVGELEAVRVVGAARSRRDAEEGLVRSGRRRLHEGGEDRDRPAAHAFLRSVRLIGSRRMRFPVAAKMALQTAGARGGTPGSPTPPGSSALSTT